MIKSNYAKAANSSMNVSLLWFGVAVSIAEILTGTMIAPLGLSKGFAAIIAGHFIGGIVLYLAGVIGASKHCSAAESIKLSFGSFGSVTFSLLNVIQLIGWISIMIIIGSQAMNNLTAHIWNMPNNTPLWSVVLGLTPCIWVLISNRSFTILNRIVMACLFVASLWLGFNTVFGTSEIVTQPDNSMTFSTAIEFNIAMCLSWMPVISDYTRTLKNPFTGTFSAVVAYCVGGILMYSIGLGAAIHYGTSDICDIFMLSGLGIIALIVILLSTVTTNFVAIHSSGICMNHIFDALNVKIVSLLVCVISTLLSIFLSMDQYESFLYFIAAIFAPLFAISFSEYFLTNNIYKHSPKITMKNCILWLIGFIVYEFLINFQITTPIGVTVPLMIATALINLFISKFIKTDYYQFNKY